MENKNLRGYKVVGAQTGNSKIRKYGISPFPVTAKSRPHKLFLTITVKTF